MTDFLDFLRKYHGNTEEIVSRTHNFKRRSCLASVEKFLPGDEEYTRIDFENVNKLPIFEENISTRVQVLKVADYFLDLGEWRPKDYVLRFTANFFGVCSGTILFHYSQITESLTHPDKERSRGRPIKLTNEIQKFVISFVERNMRKMLITGDIIKEKLKEKFGIQDIPKSSFSRLVSECELQCVQAEPEEGERLIVTPSVLIDHFTKLAQAVKDRLPQLIINLDECGFQNYADRQKIPVYFSINIKKVIFPVSRASYQTTACIAITCSGVILKPLFVIPRITADSKLVTRQYIDKIHLVSREPAFINSKIFERWIINVIIPYVKETCEKFKTSGPTY